MYCCLQPSEQQHGAEKRQGRPQGHMADATPEAQVQHFKRLMASIKALVKRAQKAYRGADHKLFVVCLLSCAAVNDHRTLHAFGTELSKVSFVSVMNAPCFIESVYCFDEFTMSWLLLRIWMKK
jgi:hypothetical protein